MSQSITSIKRTKGGDKYDWLRQVREAEALLQGISETIFNENSNDSKSSALQKYRETPMSIANKNLAASKHCPYLVILVQVVLSSIRHTQHPSSRLVGLRLILEFSTFVNDEVRLQRMIPIIVCFLEDTDTFVRATAIRVLTSVLQLIRMFPPSDALLLPRYIFPRLDLLVNDADVAVRVAFSECLAQISIVARHFLDVSEAMKLHESLGETMNENEKKDGAH